MFRHVIAPTLVVASLLAPAGAPRAEAALLMSPPWLSIESPVNPYDPATRDAVVLVHALVHDGPTAAADLAGSAEGVVGGQRRSVALRFERTTRPNVYAVRRQWPAEGAWMLRITLMNSTTALVTLAPDGTVAAARVPTQPQGNVRIPRAVTMREIDSTLAARR